MIFLSFLLLRIKHSIGEAGYLQSVEGNDLSLFLSGHRQSIGIFTDSGSRIDFASYAIYHFKDQITFFTANISEGMKYGCRSSPCILPFRYKDSIKAPKPNLRAVDFTLWCKSAFPDPVVFFSHPEELHRLLESQGTFVLGVDTSERPLSLKPEEHFYAIPSSFFPYLGFNVSSGLYVFRSADRQLVKVSGDPRNYFKTSLIDLAPFYSVNSAFYGIFFADSLDPLSSANAIEALNSILHPQFVFSIATEKQSKEYKDAGKLWFIQPPFLAIFNATDPSRRWFLRNFSESSLKSFVSGIVDGTVKQSIISEEGSHSISNHTKSIAASGFCRTVVDDKKDSAVLLVSEKCVGCRKAMAMFERAARLLKDTKLAFYVLNASVNDVPFEIGPDAELPMMFFWQDGKDCQTPIVFDSEFGIPEILQFLSLEAANKFTVPPYDEKAINDEVRDELYPFIHQVKK